MANQPEQDRDDVETLVYYPPGDWPEARSFQRTYGRNPHAQLRLVQALAGLWANAAQHLEPNGNLSGKQVDRDEAANAIATTIRYFRERFPEFASTEPLELDRDCWEGTYDGITDHTKFLIEERILEGNFDNGGVE